PGIRGDGAAAHPVVLVDLELPVLDRDRHAARLVLAAGAGDRRLLPLEQIRRLGPGAVEAGLDPQLRRHGRRRVLERRDAAGREDAALLAVTPVQAPGRAVRALA